MPSTNAKGIYVYDALTATGYNTLSGTMPTNMYGIGIGLSSNEYTTDAIFTATVAGTVITTPFNVPLYIGPGQTYSGFISIVRFKSEY